MRAWVQDGMHAHRIIFVCVNASMHITMCNVACRIDRVQLYPKIHRNSSNPRHSSHRRSTAQAGMPPSRTSKRLLVQESA